MMSIDTLRIHYHENTSELCELGRKYDTDKSSQRERVTNERHCHPYTLFYDSLFRTKRHDPLHIAELGILEGGSIRMWQDYFTHAKIDGFDNQPKWIEQCRSYIDPQRIRLSLLDVTRSEQMIHVFHELNTMYDILIEDTTHQFEDQIRVIENLHSYIKPGGILIIEDIFKSYSEQEYYHRLEPILCHFQDYYFVELDHARRNSTGWDNDKLFVLVKGGAEPIFKNTNKLTIITPSYRIDHLAAVKDSICFDYVEEWIVVYDGTKIRPDFKYFQDNEKIKEYVHEGEGISGNPQRNYALTKIQNPDTLLYYLDDDNVIHPSLYRLLDIIDPTKIYTFNQVNRIKGNNIKVGHIDTAMAIIPYRFGKTHTWIPERYDADGHYIKACYETNKKNHIYVDNDLCYYNRLS